MADENLSDDEKREANQLFYENSKLVQLWGESAPDALAAGGDSIDCDCPAHSGKTIHIEVAFPNFNVVTFVDGKMVINPTEARLNQDWLIKHLPAQAKENGGNRDIPTEGIDYAQQCADWISARKRLHFNLMMQLTGEGKFPNLEPPYPEVRGHGMRR